MKEVFDGRMFDEKPENKELVTHVMKTIGWKEFVPERFWEVFEKSGINKDKLRQIIEEELNSKDVGVE